MLPVFAGLSQREQTLHLHGIPGALLRGRSRASRRMSCRPLPIFLIPNRKSAFARRGRRSSAPPWRWRWPLASPGAADFGHDYLTTGRYLESTDDAYVKADSTIISPKVSGYIAEVLVADNEPVKAGQLLARIDDRDFRAALNQAHADVAASDAAVKQPRCADRPAAAADPAGSRRGRRRRSQPEIRAGRTGPLRRSDEVRLRHHPARPADRCGACARRPPQLQHGQVRPARGAAEDRSSHRPSAPRPSRSSTMPARSSSRRR